MRQTLDPGPRRDARIDGATALVEQGDRRRRGDDARRSCGRPRAAYYRALHATARIRLLDRAQELAAGVYNVADRRFRAGDIAVLDVNLARAALARTRADREAAGAARAVALGELKQLLLLRDELAVEGDLAAALDDPEWRPCNARRPSGPSCARSRRPCAKPTPTVRLGLASAKPIYGVGVQYSREEGDQVVLGGLTITLPTFMKGQELRAVGAARATRLRAELDAARTRIQIEVQSALDAYRERRAAVRVLEAEALPGLDESDALTTRSFDVGQISLPDLLLDPARVPRHPLSSSRCPSGGRTGARQCGRVRGDTAMTIQRTLACMICAALSLALAGCDRRSEDAARPASRRRGHHRRTDATRRMTPTPSRWTRACCATCA